MSGRRVSERRLRPLHWVLIAAILVLMGSVAAAGHLVAADAVGDGVEISATPMVTPNTSSGHSDFVDDLVEDETPGGVITAVNNPDLQDRSSDGTLGEVTSSAVERAGLKRAEKEAAESIDKTERAAAEAVGAAAEAVAEAAGARREEAEQATDVLADAAEDIAEEAEASAEAGDTERALAAADQAVAFADAAEEAAEIAVEAAVVEEVAEEVAAHPEAHDVGDIPPVPDGACEEVTVSADLLTPTEAAYALAKAAVDGDPDAECPLTVILEAFEPGSEPPGAE